MEDIRKGPIRMMHPIVAMCIIAALLCALIIQCDRLSRAEAKIKDIEGYRYAKATAFSIDCFPNDYGLTCSYKIELEDDAEGSNFKMLTER